MSRANVIIYVLLHRHTAFLALPYFSTVSHKRHDFRKKVMCIKYVLIFCTAFV